MVVQVLFFSKQKFGFVKRVDEGWVAAVKDLEG